MNKTRVALVGCGKVGGLHCKAVAQIPEAEFIAVCDADSSRASKFAIEHKAQAFTTIEEMILKAKPDVLLIATPHPRYSICHAMDQSYNIPNYARNT